MFNRKNIIHIGNYLWEKIKSIGNYFKDKFLLHVVALLLCCLIITAFCLYSKVNIELKNEYVCALKNIKETNAIMQKQLTSEKPDSILLEKSIYSCESQTKESFLNINELKQFVFDSNTLTFLVCAIITLLGGILLGIVDRTTNGIRKMRDELKVTKEAMKTMIEEKITEVTKTMEEKTNLLEKERSIFQIFINLQVVTFCIQNTIKTNHYKIDETFNLIIDQMYKIINDEKLKKDTYTDFITKNTQENAYKITSETIRVLDLEKIQKNPVNKEISTRHIVDLVKLLKTILKKIRATQVPQE